MKVTNLKKKRQKTDDKPVEIKIKLKSKSKQKGINNEEGD
jgi:hypothetical protein